MSRILCFDYGVKRIGIAVTDELRIIASPLVTCDASEIFNFAKSVKFMRSALNNIL